MRHAVRTRKAHRRKKGLVTSIPAEAHRQQSQEGAAEQGISMERTVSLLQTRMGRYRLFGGGLAGLREYPSHQCGQRKYLKGQQMQ